MQEGRTSGRELYGDQRMQLCLSHKSRTPSKGEREDRDLAQDDERSAEDQYKDEDGDEEASQYMHYNAISGPLPCRKHFTTIFLDSDIVPRVVPESADRARNPATTSRMQWLSPWPKIRRIGALIALRSILWRESLTEDRHVERLCSNDD